MLSAQTGRDDAGSRSYDPLNIKKQIREVNKPLGLKNVGNSCYLNSLLQIYYSIPEFYTEIMSFIPDEEEQKQPAGNNQQDKAPEDSNEKKRVKTCQKLIVDLQYLFAQMNLSMKGYADPTDVLAKIIDESGNSILGAGEQEDIIETNQKFLECVQEGLYHKMKAQLLLAEKQHKEDEEKKGQSVAKK